MSKIYLEVELSESRGPSALDFLNKQFDEEIENVPEPSRSALLKIRLAIKKVEDQIKNGKRYEESSLSKYLVLNPMEEEKKEAEEKAEGRSYDREGSKFQNSLYAMYRMGKLITTRQIIELWLKEDSKLLERENVTIGEMQGKLSSTLKQKTDNKNKIYRVKSIFGEEYLYGLLEWFDENLIPKPEYLPEAHRIYKKITQ